MTGDPIVEPHGGHAECSSALELPGISIAHVQAVSRRDAQPFRHVKIHSRIRFLRPEHTRVRFRMEERTQGRSFDGVGRSRRAIGDEAQKISARAQRFEEVERALSRRNVRVDERPITTCRPSKRFSFHRKPQIGREPRELVGPILDFAAHAKRKLGLQFTRYVACRRTKDLRYVPSRGCNLDCFEVGDQSPEQIEKNRLHGAKVTQQRRVRSFFTGQLRSMYNSYSF